MNKFIKGNSDLSYFWYTNFWVPDPPPLSSNTSLTPVKHSTTSLLVGALCVLCAEVLLLQAPGGLVTAPQFPGSFPAISRNFCAIGFLRSPTAIPPPPAGPFRPLRWCPAVPFCCRPTSPAQATDLVNEEMLADPVCTVTVGDEAATTTRKSNTLNPVWRERFTFTLGATACGYPTAVGRNRRRLEGNRRRLEVDVFFNQKKTNFVHQKNALICSTPSRHCAVRTCYTGRRSLTAPAVSWVLQPLFSPQTSRSAERSAAACEGRPPPSPTKGDAGGAGHAAGRRCGPPRSRSARGPGQLPCFVCGGVQALPLCHGPPRPYGPGAQGRGNPSDAAAPPPPPPHDQVLVCALAKTDIPGGAPGEWGFGRNL